MPQEALAASSVLRKGVTRLALPKSVIFSFALIDGIAVGETDIELKQPIESPFSRLGSNARLNVVGWMFGRPTSGLRLQIGLYRFRTQRDVNSPRHQDDGAPRLKSCAVHDLNSPTSQFFRTFVVSF